MLLQASIPARSPLVVAARQYPAKIRSRTQATQDNTAGNDDSSPPRARLLRLYLDQCPRDGKEVLHTA
jgi:hypothetical protein